MASFTSDRRSELLSHSKSLLRNRGFNAFSHRDLAELVGVKSSSVHYYFPTKEDIGLALIEEYRAEVMASLASQAALPVARRLDHFASMFIDAAITGDRWCVAGMLASDIGTLGETLRLAVRQFFIEIEGWLATQVRELQPDMKPATAQRLAKTVMAIMEGSLLLSRSQGEPLRAKHGADVMMQLLTGK